MMNVLISLIILDIIILSLPFKEGITPVIISKSNEYKYLLKDWDIHNRVYSSGVYFYILNIYFLMYCNLYYNYLIFVL